MYDLDECYLLIVLPFPNLVYVKTKNQTKYNTQGNVHGYKIDREIFPAWRKSS